MAAITGSVLFEDARLHSILRGDGEGYPELLSGLYLSYYRYVLKACRHFFWRPEDAEDAAAEVFLKLHTVLKNEERPLRFRPWLAKVTGRHCIDKLRQRQSEWLRRAEDVNLTTLQDALTPSPLAQVLLEEEQGRVRDELRKLPRHYRIPLVLHYYRRMSYAEIAVKLGKELPSVKTTMFRAKRMLRSRMESRRMQEAAQITAN